jgi:NADPH-dependent 2,4-dienoyl-CoA reductase/sulfur reductase-like enzyme
MEIHARLRRTYETKNTVNSTPRIGSTTISCDVLVIGGGAAGVAAATAAGHAGARVVLLER